MTHDSAFGRYLAASLVEGGAVDHVIVECGGPGGRYYWRKLRRVGPVNAVFQAWLDRWFRREGARHLPPCALPPHESVASVNGYQFAPTDLVLGFGTSLVTARTLDNTPHGFLNLHTGWLPEYRGVKSEWWTVARRDAAFAGWTLHYMTPRIDAGDIVLQHRVPLANCSAPELRAALLRDAVPNLIDFVAMVRREGFGAIPRRAQGAGTYYTTPTWRDWRRQRRDELAARTRPL